MAIGKAPFTSAWGYKNMRGTGHFTILRSEVRLSRREPDVFVDWWLSDTGTPPAPSGNSNFFFFFDEAFTAPLAVVIMIGTFWPL